MHGLNLFQALQPAFPGRRIDLRNAHADSDIGIRTLSWIDRGGDGGTWRVTKDKVVKLDFDRCLLLSSTGPMVASDAGLLERIPV
jgi:hypothetical protein